MAGTVVPDMVKRKKKESEKYEDGRLLFILLLSCFVQDYEIMKNEEAYCRVVGGCVVGGCVWI